MRIDDWYVYAVYRSYFIYSIKFIQLNENDPITTIPSALLFVIGPKELVALIGKEDRR
jgi:hypothetical protein